jgi:uncharacterized protein (DUF1778 family)
MSIVVEERDVMMERDDTARVRVTTYLPPDVRAEIERRAALADRSVSDFVGRILVKALKSS